MLEIVCFLNAMLVCMIIVVMTFICSLLFDGTRKVKVEKPKNPKKK